MATPRRLPQPAPVHPEVLACFAAFEEVLEAILVFTAPGSEVYLRNHRTAADANRTGKRLLGDMRKLRHEAQAGGNGAGNGRARE